MVDYSQFLDLYDLFVNHIAGGTTLFIVLSFVVVAFLAAKLKFPNSITIVIFAVYAIMISAFFVSVLAIALFMVGVFFAWGLIRMLSNK